MKKGTFSLLVFISLILIGFVSTTDHVYSSTYYQFHRSIKVGSEFEWTVTRCEYTNLSNSIGLTYTDDLFKVGDKFKAIVKSTPSNSGWDHIMGSVSWMDFFKNNIQISWNTLTIWRADFSKILTHHTYIYNYGFIYPNTAVEDGKSKNYFDQYYGLIDELIENSRYSPIYSQNLTRQFYEISDNNTGIIYYRKYNIKTGVLAVYRETFEMEGYESHVFELVNFSQNRHQVLYFIPLFVVVPIASVIVLRIIKQRQKRVSLRSGLEP